MKRRLMALALVAGICTAPTAGAAVTKEHFLMRDGHDLAVLCGAGPDDPYFERALAFCHGYLVGSYDFYRGTSAGRPSKQLFCLPNPPPARYEVALKYADWAKRNPQNASQSAVDALFRFAVETWPCRKRK
jgi:hypothetical protein